jgi:hypothetical protein
MSVERNMCEGVKLLSQLVDLGIRESRSDRHFCKLSMASRVDAIWFGSCEDLLKSE